MFPMCPCTHTPTELNTEGGDADEAVSAVGLRQMMDGRGLMTVLGGCSLPHPPLLSLPLALFPCCFYSPSFLPSDMFMSKQDSCLLSITSDEGRNSSPFWTRRVSAAHTSSTVCDLGQTANWLIRTN